MASVELVTELPGHTDRCWSVAWNPRRPLLATCSGDKSVRLYSYRPAFPTPDRPSPKDSEYVFMHVVTFPVQHTRTVRHVAWHPNGKMLATAGFDSSIGIWMETETDDNDDVENGSDDGVGVHARMQGLDQEVSSTKQWECIATLEGHESEVKCVAWSRDGSLLASCGRDRSVWVWEVLPDLDFECLAVLMEHSQDVKYTAFHPKEELLVSASYDDTIRMYVCEPSSDEWVCSHVLPPPPPSHFSQAHSASATSSNTGHDDTVWVAVFSPSGRNLVSCSADARLKIWSRKEIEYDRQHDISTGGFRIGKSEREKWDCIKTFGKDVFERPVYSADWYVANDSSTRDPSAGEMGVIAAGGQDGKIAIWETKETKDGVDVHLISETEDSHGIHDINCVSFCRVSMPKNSINTEETMEIDDDDDDDIGDPDGSRARFQGARGLLATAGDDGNVKIWRLSRHSEQ